MTDPVLNACRSLYSWLLEADLRGHDPHDLLESPLIPGILKRSTFARLALLQAGRRSPVDLHTLLRVPRRFNAKGGALVLQGLLRGKDQIHPEWAKHAPTLATLLLDSAVPTRSGIGWGYPFDWQSRTHFVPKNTPTIVSTSFVAEALLEYHAHDPSEALLAEITRAADYIQKDVSQIRTSQGICFGYSEGDKQRVFNASLLGAAFLGKLGALLGEDPYTQSARDAARFVIGHQDPSGAWPYGLDSSQRWVDSFHTGYVLLSLKEIGEALLTNELMPAIERGYNYYRSTFFRTDGLPRYFANREYPIDTHAAAHAIIMLNTFKDQAAATHVARWMCANMQNADGSFMYQKHERYMNKIPYIRWSNAWMFLAMADHVSRKRA